MDTHLWMLGKVEPMRVSKGLVFLILFCRDFVKICKHERIWNSDELVGRRNLDCFLLSNMWPGWIMIIFLCKEEKCYLYWEGDVCLRCFEDMMWLTEFKTKPKLCELTFLLDSWCLLGLVMRENKLEVIQTCGYV